MKKLTQSQPTNCWQTCVAMLLGCAADDLPDQSAIGDQKDRQQYMRKLGAFLAKHYGVVYREYGLGLRSLLVAQRAAHLMIGETVRTTQENDSCHAIVGIAGEPYWDVHPSRAGLTNVQVFGVLEPIAAADSKYGCCECRKCVAVEDKHAS